MSGPAPSPSAAAAAIAGLAARLADGADPLGAAARAACARDGGLSGPMVEWALRTACARYEPGRLDACARGLDLAGRHVALVLASGVPTAPLRAIALPLLRGARRLEVRASRTRPGFAPLVVGALAAAGLPIAAAAAGEPEAFVPAAVGRGADVVVAYGGDETLRALRAGLPAGVRFEGHGHGFGVALVSREAAAGGASAEAVARDVAHYDQAGCLSPQAVFVEGPDARGFARRLADALAALAAELPGGPPDAAAVARVRQWQGAVAAGAVDFWRAGVGGVAALADARLVGSPGWRNVAVAPAPDPAAAAAALAPYAAHLTCVGVAGERSRWPLPAGARPRVVAAGSMQDPPLDGPEDPRPPWG